MVASRTTTTTTGTRGRRPHKARTFLTYSVPGGASRAAESISLRDAVRVRCPGLTRPGGLAVAPPKHPKAGQVFVTEYGSEGRSGRVLALDGGGSSVYLDFTDLPCHAGTPQDLVNPWTLAFGPAGDALYVATDPNHRTVHRFDAAGKLVRAERCADEAPNYLLCV